MLIEQDVSLGLAKAVEVRRDKPRKTAASIVLFVAFILAFLLFLGLSHFNDPLPTTGFVGRRAAYTRFLSHELEVWVPFQQRLGSATQDFFTSVEISRHDCSSCVAKHAPESAETVEMFGDPRGKSAKPAGNWTPKGGVPDAVTIELSWKIPAL
jgi:hypothetical protein